MDHFLNVVPHMFWGAIALIVFFCIGPSHVRSALSKASKIQFAGLEIELKSGFDAIAEAREIQLPPQSRDRLVRRLESIQSSIAASRILWVDDKPQNNIREIRLLRNLGATIDLANSETHARERLQSSVYDLVLSDMCHGEDSLAGRQILPLVKAAMLSPPLIYYVGMHTDVPKGAFGLTVRFDELFHLIADVLVRNKS